jgi:16S rRNA (cytidine1402-2'-O)-methyltransferase
MGILYLVATPIGNLEDMSYRAVRTLNEVDYIAAEDTRHTLKLLNHFDIHKKLVSYHEHNKIEKGPDIIRDLLNGKNIALVTDAGTPAISDPGEDLVKLCFEAGVTVTAIPGPAALITGLILSGQDTRRFVFEGFLPMQKKERKERLEMLVNETRTIILYEAPHKLKATLNDLKATLNDDRILTLTRELTKKFEEVLRMTLSEAINYYKEHDPRGEYVLVLEGCSKEGLIEKEQVLFEALSLEDHLQHYLKQGLNKKEAIKEIAKDRNKPKREIYQYFIE